MQMIKGTDLTLNTMKQDKFQKSAILATISYMVF